MGHYFHQGSTRTRVSFEVGIRELGGNVMFLSGNDIQLGRGEPIKDTARVLGRMVHGAVIRTFDQEDVEDFSSYSGIPTINALTDKEHPCQILADLLTIEEKLGNWEGKKVVFIGDGNNNMSRSWMWAAKYLGFEFVVAAPESCLPPQDFIDHLDAPNVALTTDPAAAAKNADVITQTFGFQWGKRAKMKKKHFLATIKLTTIFFRTVLLTTSYFIACQPTEARKSAKRLWKRMLTPFSNKQKIASTSRKAVSQLSSDDHSGN